MCIGGQDRQRAYQVADGTETSEGCRTARVACAEPLPAASSKDTATVDATIFWHLRSHHQQDMANDPSQRPHLSGSKAHEKSSLVLAGLDLKAL